MGYWDNQEAYTLRGIDYDFSAAVFHNNVDVELDNVAKVLAVWAGENDGDSWRWIFVTNDKRYGYMVGWCDYTGWDCQSSCNVVYFSTIVDAVRHMINVELDANQDVPMHDIRNVVGVELIKQLTTQKQITWSEAFNINKED